MPKEIDYWDLIPGESFDDFTRIPEFEDTEREQIAMLSSKYDLRRLSPSMFFSEEMRSNIHVIGSSRQGKSYFIEWLMREDIDRDLGCCLLDPSAGGATAYRLLAYCAEKKKQNVLFIDLAHIYDPHKKIVALQPFKYDKDSQRRPQLRTISVDTLTQAVRDLYGVKDPSDQSRIERYLKPVFAALYDAERPVSDAIYFTNRLYQDECDEILSATDPQSRTDLREALYTTPALYQNFQSTVNRLIRFTSGTVGNMFSFDKGVDWMRVVRDNWIVIVRLDNVDVFDARLLGTYVIAELNTAKQRLGEAMDRNRDFKHRGEYAPFYLYADEAYLFASQSLRHILDIKQKMNFKVTLAHHYAKQFDPEMYESIKVNCDMTVQFNVRGRQTRDDISSEMYGGDIDYKDASYANSNLSKQQAVIKIGNGPPERTRLPDVPNPDVTNEELNNYIINLYHQLTERGWYYDYDPHKLQKNIKNPQQGKVANHKPARKTASPGGVRKKPSDSIRPDKQEPPKSEKTEPLKF